jgi:hypothetical protein
MVTVTEMAMEQAQSFIKAYYLHHVQLLFLPLPLLLAPRPPLWLLLLENQIVLLERTAVVGMEAVVTGVVISWHLLVLEMAPLAVAVTLRMGTAVEVITTNKVAVVVVAGVLLLMVTTATAMAVAVTVVVVKAVEQVKLQLLRLLLLLMGAASRLLNWLANLLHLLRLFAILNMALTFTATTIAPKLAVLRNTITITTTEGLYVTVPMQPQPTTAMLR